MRAHPRFECPIGIAAPPGEVYRMLVGARSYGEWTSAFGEGLYFDGSWRAGERIGFLTPDGHGVVPEIAENRPGEFLSLRHLGYIDDDGEEDTDSVAILSLAPACENFTFTPTPQGTRLNVHQDLAGVFDDMPAAWPAALATLKALREAHP